ncbi:helicase, partial [bacterium CPR1]|nr:helicase [bacterium CPR1]
MRSRLVEALRLDLVGPCPDEAAHQAYEREILPQTPSQWYLTGFLVPSDTKLPYKSDPDADETLDLLDEIGGGDDENEPEPASASKGIFPSSMGLSILVSAETTTLEAIVRWGDYRKLPAEESQDGRRSWRWQREPRQAQLSLALPRAMGSRSVPV